MDGSSVPFKVAVVGGGLSGLAVAKGLQRAGERVQVTVYERRGEDSSFSKFPIRIAPEGRQALEYLLSPEEHAHLLRLSDHGIKHGGITIFTETFSHLFSIAMYENEQPQFAHRWVLANVLSEFVHIRRGKRVVRVREIEGRKIEIVFDDATVERADLVIGADGLGSTLCAQLHPDHARVPLMPYLVVQCKLLTPRSQLPHIKPGVVNMILGKKAYSLLMTPFAGSPVPPLPDEVDPFSDQNAQTTLDALDETCPEYIFCAFGIKSFEGWEDMTPLSWIDKIAGILSDDGADRALVDAVRGGVVPQTIGAWHIVSMDPGNMIPWKGGRCVLMGDAAHALPPQGGVGGSIALKDAERLVQVLRSSSELGGSAGPIDDLLPGFHDEMMTRGAAYIKDAQRRMRLSHKEGLGVFWQRALLRVMNLVTPFALWVLSRGRVALERATLDFKQNKKEQ